MNEQTKDGVYALCDIVRQTAYDIHCYLGPGHIEKVYENALAHRLRKKGFKVITQYQSEVFDEDGERLGVFFADLFVDDRLIVEVKAVKVLIDEHIAQMLGYLRSADIEYGVVINFGYNFKARMLAYSKKYHEPESKIL